MTTRDQAYRAVKAAMERGDTRGQSKATKAAYRATHAVLAGGPNTNRKSLLARLLGRAGRNLTNEGRS